MGSYAFPVGSQPNLADFIRPHILKMKAFVSPTIDDGQARKGILLDANESALGSCLAASQWNQWDTAPKGKGTGDDDAAVLALSNSLGLHRYPSASLLSLKKQLAASRGLPAYWAGKITFGVGSSDLVDTLIRATCVPSRDAILITPPTFPLYAMRAQLDEVRVLTSWLRLDGGDFYLDEDEVIGILRENNVKLTFLASPGNPTGTLIPLTSIRKILESGALKGLLVVDEAYIDFAAGAERSSAVSLMEEFPHLVILQTLSKSHGLAGLRLGVLYAHEAITEVLKKVQVPFAIPSPSAAIAMAALSPAREDARRALVASVVQNRTELVRAFSSPSFRTLGAGPPIGGNSANFVVLPVWARPREDDPDESERQDDGVKVPDGSRATEVCELLRSRHDIAVRYIGNNPGCSGCLRVTVGTAEENNLLIQGFLDVLRMCG
ncbi:PLP-dependent transferase [Sodiomyces alkalinus F11]|uniref:histidinol-phosphate transaminase n=1 Tax=Sodiomyces alkalinus (strain CBS 110278 / VKM F-3762 / F11) TaxID=1314773 RepID=A0A3N2PT19_SODAK|nr:PLP-dependent transferase [Sodiomyces alkalinus F11]ROT37640.1 PLP-dependent transferase [Sodiomyces alkalinus F11]